MEQIVAKIKGKIVVKFAGNLKWRGEMFQRTFLKRFKNEARNLNRLNI
ncbi:hypothetical protein [Rhizobium esperanzae]|uniref:Uncharacterized protein n=1 Tax=Rhizobium esperanzae TaxID=1967781 RepID=A0A7W6W645_9HYPH|nr:hypothetical protein [Rhizobium esperanzae]MBB4237193.1 hypothetical protein [Rhizobium esperanzae]